MAHYRKPLAAAAALNTAIFAVEAIAGLQADSLSLLMDSVLNLSDEMALVFLYLAFVLPHGISRQLLRSANVFNSVGLVLISGLLLWQAVERMLHPCVCRKPGPFNLMKESRTVGHGGRAILFPFEAVTFTLQADQPTRG